MINELKIDLHSSEVICSQKISYSLWLILVNVMPQKISCISCLC